MLNKKLKRPIRTEHTDTIIGEGSVIEGSVHSNASLRIEGKVKGDIHCKGDITIGAKGTAESNIKARNVTIAGTVEGSVHTKGSINITHTGKLIGNMVTGALTIAQGGIFQGVSKMEPKSIQLHTENSDNNQQNLQEVRAMKRAAADE